MPANTASAAHERPAVKTTFFAGAVATVGLWVWNTAWGDLSRWNVEDNQLVTGAVVTIVAGAGGPIRRMVLRWLEK